MNSKEIILSGLLELYVAGLTNGEETRQVQEWALLYPEVRAEITAIEQAVEAQAMAQAVAPSGYMKAKILAAITAQESAASPTLPQGKYVEMSPRPVASKKWKWLVAASVLLLLGSIGVYLLNNQVPKKGPDLTVQPPSPKPPSFKNIIQEHVSSEKEMKAAAGFVKIILKKAPNAPMECDAAIFWNKKTGELYFDPCHLPNAPAGKQYQVWAIVGGKPVSAGVVITDGVAGKFVIQKMNPFTKAESFAVTLEEKGGKDQPTLEQTFVEGKT